MNCKPGDLAFILAGHSVFPENIGKVVRVIKRSEHAELDWFIKSEGGLLKTTVGLMAESNCVDRALSPIRPEPERLPAPPVVVTA